MGAGKLSVKCWRAQVRGGGGGTCRQWTGISSRMWYSLSLNATETGISMGFFIVLYLLYFIKTFNLYMVCGTFRFLESYQVCWTQMRWVTFPLCCSANRIANCFKFYKREYFFPSCHERETQTSSKSPWGIEPQTFEFRAPTLNHWIIKTLQWTKRLQGSYMTHVLHTAKISNVESL